MYAWIPKGASAVHRVQHNLFFVPFWLPSCCVSAQLVVISHRILGSLNVYDTLTLYSSVTFLRIVGWQWG